MHTIDAGLYTTRELNLEIKALANKNGDIAVLNPQARHNLAVGILEPCKLTFRGSVGYYCCAFSDGIEATIEGNAGWGLGTNLMGGKIIAKKKVGSSVGCSLRGGEVLVEDDAGARAGISMKGGTLIIKGNAGFLTGFMVQKGRIIICGNVGDSVGDSMYEGIIYVGEKISSLGNDAKLENMESEDFEYISEALARFDIKEDFQWKKIVSAKKLYHYDSLESLERISLGRVI